MRICARCPFRTLCRNYYDELPKSATEAVTSPSPSFPSCGPVIQWQPMGGHAGYVCRTARCHRLVCSHARSRHHLVRSRPMWKDRTAFDALSPGARPGTVGRVALACPDMAGRGLGARPSTRWLVGRLFRSRRDDLREIRRNRSPQSRPADSSGHPRDEAGTDPPDSRPANGPRTARAFRLHRPNLRPDRLDQRVRQRTEAAGDLAGTVPRCLLGSRPQPERHGAGRNLRRLSGSLARKRPVRRRRPTLVGARCNPKGRGERGRGERKQTKVSTLLFSPLSPLPSPLRSSSSTASPIFTRTQHEILETLAGRANEMHVSLPIEAEPRRNDLFAKPLKTLKQLRRRHPGAVVEDLARPQRRRMAGNGSS